MHVALVSTFPPARCGIGGYSAELAAALRQAGARVTVLAEEAPGAADVDDGDTLRCWNRRGPWQRELAARLESLRPDVVHVQHEEAILGQDGKLPELFGRARALGVGAVVTLHSVYDGALGVPGLRWSPLAFQRELGRAADRLVVHQRAGCADRLLAQGVEAERVAVIPHGTRELALPSRADARAELGLDEDALTVLAIGFIHKKKGLHTLVDAFGDVARAVPRAQLVVAGSFRRRPWDHAYRLRLRAKMRPGQDAGWLVLHEGFHGDDAMRAYLAAADVVALPYRQRYGSASGVLHLALAAGRPVVCASGYKFAEAAEAWGDAHPDFFPAPDDAPAWARALTRVLEDADTRTELAERARTLGQETSWPRVAGLHLDTYRAAARRD